MFQYDLTMVDQRLREARWYGPEIASGIAGAFAGGAIWYGLEYLPVQDSYWNYQDKIGTAETHQAALQTANDFLAEHGASTPKTESTFAAGITTDQQQITALKAYQPSEGWAQLENLGVAAGSGITLAIVCAGVRYAIHRKRHPQMKTSSI